MSYHSESLLLISWIWLITGFYMTLFSLFTFNEIVCNDLVKMEWVLTLDSSGAFVVPF